MWRAVLSCCYNFDGSEILCGSKDGCIKIYDGKNENKLKMSIGGYNVAVFSPDGKEIDFLIF